MNIKLLMFCLVLLGCTKNDYYDLDAVTIKGVEKNKNNQITVSFQTRIESLYFSPGLIWVKEKNADNFRVVRCPIKSTCKVDIENKQVDGHYEATLPKGISEEVYFLGKTTKKVKIKP